MTKHQLLSSSNRVDYTGYTKSALTIFVQFQGVETSPNHYICGFRSFTSENTPPFGSLNPTNGFDTLFVQKYSDKQGQGENEIFATRSFYYNNVLYQPNQIDGALTDEWYNSDGQTVEVWLKNP